MARTLSGVTAVAGAYGAANLTFSYTGTYDGGSNAPECGGALGQVFTSVYSRNVTDGGSFALVSTLAGGTTGQTSVTVLGLTTGKTWEFRADSFQRVSVWNPGDLRCDPSDSAASGNKLSNQVAIPSARLTADAGAVTLSGKAATLRAGRTLPADAVAYALSGQDAGLRPGYKLPAEAGSYELTGQAATLAVAGRMGVGPASLTLIGGEAVLRWGRSMPVEGVSYVLTGLSVRFTHWAKPSPDATAWTPQGASAADWTAQTNTAATWAPQ